MFNLNTSIDREITRRDAALAQLKHELSALAQVDVVADAVRNKPWETCAVSLGAGLAASALLTSRSASTPAQPQRIIIDLHTGQASADSPARLAAPTLLDLVMQGINLVSSLRTPPVEKPEAQSCKTGNAIPSEPNDS
ncbi:MAG TPA: hypothetical protein VKX17_11840 [Planctomycetota bacterium]|nr:hypothetical protein [Planctomycetota bacterium]